MGFSACASQDVMWPAWSVRRERTKVLEAVAEAPLHDREHESLQAHLVSRCLDPEARGFVRGCLRQCLQHVGRNEHWFDDADFEDLVADARCYKFEAGERLTWQGAHVDAVIIIEQGKLEVTSNHVHLGTLTRGQMIGTILDNFNPPPHIRAFSVGVAEDSNLFGISVHVFHRVVSRAMQRSRRMQEDKILEFFSAHKCFEVFSYEEKKLLASASFTRDFALGEESYAYKGKVPWGIGSLITRGGASYNLTCGISFIMEGHVKLNQYADIGPGDCLDMWTCLWGRETVQRNHVPLKLKSSTRALWINFEELDRKVANELACKLRHFDRRRPQLTELRQVSHLGTGSFGSVHLVEHARTGINYALKKVPKRCGSMIAQNECALLDDTKHPFVLQLVTAVETDDSVCMITEALGGGALFELMSQVRRKSKRNFSRKEAQFYIGSISIGLEVLHSRNIVHRDLKPENVMIDSVGYVRLIDLGIAKKLDAQGRTFTAIGTCTYMAPEMFSAKKPGYGTSVDFWALGMLLHELVCGCKPFGLSNDTSDPLKVFKTIRDGTKRPLQFPEGYADASGRNLLQALIQKDPCKRLSLISDLQMHKYFEINLGKSNLFEQLAAWEIEPPFETDHDTCFGQSKTDVPPSEDRESSLSSPEHALSNSPEHTPRS